MCVCVFRCDEEWGDEEDDTEKRKKDFGDLFKKQMRLRKVSTRTGHSLAEGQMSNLMKTYPGLFFTKNVT